jgi:hypothetical protein
MSQVGNDGLTFKERALGSAPKVTSKPKPKKKTTTKKK